MLSIHQSDVIGYGAGLADWLYREFGIGSPATRRVRRTVRFRTVRFRSDLIV